MAEIKVFGLTFDTANITDLHKYIAGGVICALILGITGWQFIYPTYQEYERLKKEVTELEIDRDKKQNKLKMMPELKAEYEQLQKDIALIRLKIPKTQNIPSLLIDLERLTTSNNIPLNSFSPAALQNFELPANLTSSGSSEKTSVEKELKQLPINLTIGNTDFISIMNLFSDLENYERTLTMSNLSLTSSGSTDKDSKFEILNISFNLYTFVLGG